ncbi:hypothetical protein BU26DRAFT_381178, partial [Trematosphaeria pertusa]
FVLFATINFSTQVLEVPQIRLFESTICERFYRMEEALAFDSIDETMCKVPQVQARLATIVGWKAALDALPGLVGALPYGSLSNSRGRRLVLWLPSLGYILQLMWIVLVCKFSHIFPTETVLVSSGFLLIGGGQRVFESMIQTIIAETSSQDCWTRYMSFLGAILHIGKLSVPRITAGLMGRSLWAPFCIASLLVSSSAFLSMWVPDRRSSTERHNHNLSSPRDQCTANETSNVISGNDAHMVSSAGSRAGPSNTAFRQILRLIQNGLSEIRLLLRSKSLRFCFSAFLLKRIGFKSETFMFQYVSEKFHWSLRMTTWLTVTNAMGAVFVTLIVLPVAVSIGASHGFRSDRVELLAVRTSLLILTSSFFAAWRSSDDRGFLAGS